MREASREDDQSLGSVGEVDREEEVSHVAEVNLVGVVGAEVVVEVSRVGEVDRVVEVDHVVEANHVAVVERAASHELGHVMVEANLGGDVIQAHPLLIITADDPNQECVGDHLQLQIDVNQIDHVTLADLEVKIEGKSSCSI